MEVYTGTFNKGVQLRCTSCSISFDSQQSYKEHYKSQFHRYNIKRKSINLQPATYEQYLSKKKQTIKQQVQIKVCGQCKKTFNSIATYNQHIISKKHHSDSITSKQIPQRKPSANGNVARQISQLLCLFCNKKQDTIEKNINHMKRSHGFFIAEEDYCIDKKSLLNYLQEKIQIGLMCIYCENKGTKDFSSGQAVRNHMKDKGHCFMKIDLGFQQYQKYYDFSKLFDAKIEQQKVYKKLEGIAEEVIQVQNQKNNNQQQDQWEDDDSQSFENQQQQEIIDKKDENIIKQKQKKIKTTKYTIFKPTVTKHDQLLLPSGKLLGHRKYKHLYKQYYRPHYIDLNLKKILGNQYTGTNALSKRYYAIQHIKRQVEIKTTKHRADVTLLNLKVKQNRLQYYFRVQNPK